MPHPSRVIRGGRSRMLEGRRIVLAVAGSIAAVEAPRIARELLRHGAEVVPVMSPEATRIVSPEALRFATGHAPVLELTGDVEHVSLLGPGEGQADLLLIAPATANTVAKIAHGIDDTAVTSCASIALGGGVPVLLAPAMHGHMGRNPAVVEALRRLKGWGVGILEPQRVEGEEKIPTPEAVAAAVLHRLGRPPWAGRRVVVIGGASREPIDEVRSLTNESSGETAVALATTAYQLGADVALWAGAMHRNVPEFLPVRRWRRVADLLAEVRASAGALRSADAILVPAALSDFTVEPRPGKIPSRGTDPLTLELRRAPKVLPAIRRAAGTTPRLVGFKLEADGDRTTLEARARALREEVPLDAVVANEARVLGEDRSEVLWIDATGRSRWIEGPKAEVASGILGLLGEILPPAPAARATPAGRHRPRPPRRGRRRPPPG